MSPSLVQGCVDIAGVTWVPSAGTYSGLPRAWAPASAPARAEPPPPFAFAPLWLEWCLFPAGLRGIRHNPSPGSSSSRRVQRADRDWQQGAGTRVVHPALPSRLAGRGDGRQREEPTSRRPRVGARWAARAPEREASGWVGGPTPRRLQEPGKFLRSRRAPAKSSWNQEVAGPRWGPEAPRASGADPGLQPQTQPGPGGAAPRALSAARRSFCWFLQQLVCPPRRLEPPASRPRGPTEASAPPRERGLRPPGSPRGAALAQGAVGVLRAILVPKVAGDFRPPGAAWWAQSVGAPGGLSESDPAEAGGGPGSRERTLPAPCWCSFRPKSSAAGVCSIYPPPSPPRPRLLDCLQVNVFLSLMLSLAFSILTVKGPWLCHGKRALR